MKNYIFIITLSLLCMIILCSCASSQIKESYDQITSEDSSLHEKIVVYREMRRTVDVDKKKDYECYGEASKFMREMFKSTPPWKLNLDSLTDEDLEWLGADRGKGLSLYNFHEAGMGLNFTHLFSDWEKYFEDEEIQATANEQLAGVKNMALLYSYDIVRNDNPLTYLHAVIRFAGDVPELTDSRQGSLPSGADDLKILILTNGIVLEPKLMIENLPPDMIPETTDDIDILINIDDTRGVNVSGPSSNRTIEYWGSTHMYAYDFDTGLLLADINNDYKSIESFLTNLIKTE